MSSPPAWSALTARAIRATPVEVPTNFVLSTSMGAINQVPSQRADVNRIPMSSHLFPEVSAHLLTATPTWHFLEYVDCADALLQEPLTIVDGNAIVPNRHGNGMVWNKDAIARYRFD